MNKETVWFRIILWIFSALGRYLKIKIKIKERPEPEPEPETWDWDESQIRYIEANGDYCLYCGGTNTVMGLTEFIDGNMYHGAYCKDCKKAWADIYTLVGIDERTDLSMTENGACVDDLGKEDAADD
jgi:hypothetical protein